MWRKRCHWKPNKSFYVIARPIASSKTTTTATTTASFRGVHGVFRRSKSNIWMSVKTDSLIPLLQPRLYPQHHLIILEPTAATVANMTTVSTKAEQELIQPQLAIDPNGRRYRHLPKLRTTALPVRDGRNNQHGAMIGPQRKASHHLRTLFIF